MGQDNACTWKSICTQCNAARHLSHATSFVDFAHVFSFYIVKIEQSSFECRKTKTKDIKKVTLAILNSRKESSEPIRARSKYMSPAPSAGKRARVNHDWFNF